MLAVAPKERLEVLFDELAELSGQRNAIDARIVEIAAEIENDRLRGITGARSLAALMAWKTGTSPTNANTIATIAGRLTQFPRCVAGMREGRLSLDQVGVIAARAADGSDDHYAPLAAVATVTQLRTAVRLEPRPEPSPWAPKPSITKTSDEQFTCWRIRLAHPEAALFDAALKSHHDALIAQYKRDHNLDDTDDNPAEYDPHTKASPLRAPFPTTLDAFLQLVETGWDADVARRPHGHHTTVLVHLDVKEHLASLHLGPLLTDAERRYLTCDATAEVWFHRDGNLIGAGRSTRLINRRLRRALEHRHPTCAVPGCGATRGLHAHHLKHWEDGGLTEMNNLILLCPYHHRMHHRGEITITGPPERLTVTDDTGQTLSPASLARPPTTPPPNVPPCPGPLGERAQWWWYNPFEHQPPSDN
ncbi:DUF222 domain-containing protein [Mycobacterium barrassiae]|uniref:HNH endonuclease signature motif containing protein n=1 Tax=Mycobacterium barrassiae TaxID=319709 RepID=UPI002265D679|nr:HNH endonuclease signature motif containing protein [Mycobacterium barrassiae]MCV7298635.1 DUF222 domain-containing protein [Mycobacterium barrassiae]